MTSGDVSDEIRLSVVEEQVILLVAQGRSVRAVAEELGVSLKTVEWHVIRARRKLERAATLRDRVQQADLSPERREG